MSSESRPHADERHLTVVEPQPQPQPIDAAVVRHVYTDHDKALIRTMIGAKDDEIDPAELDICLHVAGRSGLDIFAKQIYFIPRWDNKLKRYKLTIQTGIDGFRLIAARTGELAGIDDPEYGPEDDEGHPTWARCTVWRFVRDHRVSFTATARWREYAQYGKSKDGTIYLTGKWEDMPYLMLGKCAEALALRKGFPAELSGIYSDDEMGQADNPSRPPQQRTIITEQTSGSQHGQHGQRDRDIAALDEQWANSVDEGAYAALHDRARQLGVSDAKWREAKAHFKGDAAGIGAWLDKIARRLRPTPDAESTYDVESAAAPVEDIAATEAPTGADDAEADQADQADQADEVDTDSEEASAGDPLFGEIWADTRIRRRLDTLGYKRRQQVIDFVATARARGAERIEDARVVLGQLEAEADRAAANAPSLEQLGAGQGVRP